MHKHVDGRCDICQCKLRIVKGVLKRTMLEIWGGDGPPLRKITCVRCGRMLKIRISLLLAKMDRDLNYGE